MARRSGVPLPGYPIRAGLGTPTQWGGKSKPKPKPPVKKSSAKRKTVKRRNVA